MVLLGVAMLAAGLMGVWHVTKYAVPRALRAVGNRRRAGIDAWKAANPSAPAFARWGAAAARTVAALRWGPKHLLAEIKKAWAEGLEAGRHKYGVVKAEEPTAVPDPMDPTGTKTCPQCKGEVVVDGQICPSCLARQEERNRQFDAAQPPRPRPYLIPVPNPSGQQAGQPKESTTMTIQTTTGGEIVNAEQFHAEARAIEAEAAAEMEDAAADAKRAEEDQARIERMVASLTGVQALSSDISAVSALKDPAAARAAAAKARLAAADQRLAGAKAVAAIAAKHVQLIGTAAGSFYNAA
jgi:hypothetical protein